MTASRLNLVLASACVLIAAFSPLRAWADTAGVPWTGQSGITKTVEKIMAEERQAVLFRTGPVRNKPYFRANRRGLPKDLPATDATTVAGGMKVPDSGSLTPQSIGTSFTGATLADVGGFPPDTMGAVGPSQFVVAVNGRIRTFNKATGVADGAMNVDMDVFFASVMSSASGTTTSDPRIRYDRLSGRWFVTIIDVPGGAGALPNRVLVAVSSGSTIVNSSSFTFFFFNHDTVAPSGDTGKFADYPTLGIDNNALYIGVNLASTSTGRLTGETTGFVVRKSSVLGVGPIVVTAFRGLTGTGSSEGPSTPQGVDNYDPTASEGYFIGVSPLSYGRLVVRRVSTPSGTPTISANILLTVPSTRYPMTVPHLGNTGGINGNLDASDDRLFAAHIRNGRLWTAHNIQVNASGVASTSGGRNGSRWYEIQNLTATPSVVQSGTVFDSAASNPKSFWIPSIMVSGQGHVAMGFSTAGAADRANAGTVGRLSGDTLGTMQAPVDYTSSSTGYNPPGDPGKDLGGYFARRWGDYSYTSLDPNDDMTMWTIQEFCDADNSYAVRVARLLAPPPATPASCSPPSVATGQANVNVTVTGTQSSGSGFFDPGSGFPNRLAAVVNGGGVTVNSVSFSSPTTIIVNVTVSAGATVGARTITVTNPDGQMAASIAGILTIISSVPLLANIESGALSYTENQAATNITSTLTVSDADSANLVSGTVSITSGFASAQDVLAMSPNPQNGISASYNSGTGALTLSGSSSVANYQAALRNVTYVNGSDNPSTATRTVSFKVNDGLADSSPQTRNIAVTAVNDAPTLTTVSTLPGAIEDTAFTISFATLGAASNTNDVDGGALQFRIEAVSSGTLTKGGLAVVPGTLLGSGESLVWTPGTNANGIANAFTVKVWDGALYSATAVQVQVAVAAVNDAPMLTTVSTLPGATEDTAFPISFAILGAASNTNDVDGGALQFRIEAVSSGTLTKGGSAVVPGATMLGSGESLVWLPGTNANGITNAFTVKVWDGALYSATAVQVQVQVAAVNDTPTLDPINTLAIEVNAGLQTVNLTNISSGASNEIQVLTVTATSSNTGLIPTPTISYSTPKNAGTLSFTPVANASGSAVLTVTVQDDGSPPGTFSRQFTVQVSSPANVAIAQSANPSPVPAGSNLVYSLTVTNRGPSAAVGLFVTNTFPATASFVNATASQGTWANNSGRVVFDLGSLANGASALVTISTTPSTAGQITNLVQAITTGSSDPDLADNAATNVATVLPVVLITASDPAASEAGLDAGAFTVSRIGGNTGTLLVNYTITGTATPGSDYTALPGSVMIPNGASQAQIVVTPLDDFLVEPSETVVVILTAAAPYFVSASSNATVTLSDNDVQGLVLSAATLNVPEGSSASYTVRLNAQPASDVKVTNTFTSGDADLSVTAGASLTFTPATWNIPQPVSISAAEDGDSLNGQATFAVASPGLPSLTVTATEVDNDQPPQLSVSPASLTFGTVLLGSIRTQIVSVVNTGGLTLTGSATSSVPFSVVTGSPFSLSGGQTALVQLAFSPTNAGVFGTNVVFISNGGNSTNPVSGTGVTAAQLAASPASTNFGTVLVGGFAERTFVVTNRGGAALSNGVATVGAPFSIISGSPFSLAGFGWTNVVVRFTPLGNGTFNTNVIFTSSGGNSTNAVSGVGQTPGQIAVAPTNWDFGWVAVGSNASRTFLVTNRGGATVTNGLANVAAPFSVVSGSPFTLLGFGTTNVVVRFTPAGEGTFSNNVLFTSGNGGSATNPVTGKGAVVPMTSFTGTPTSGAFPLDVLFTDNSSGTITNRFWDFGDGLVLNTNATSVAHRYTSARTNSVSLTVTGPVGSSNLLRAGYIVVTNPPPTAPEIVVEQPAGTNLVDGVSIVDFGNRLVGTYADLTFTIRNSGTANLTGLGITINGTNAGDFGVITSPTAPVVPGGNTTFTVRFAPGAPGSRSAALHIASNDADENSFDITLAGIGNVSTLFRPGNLPNGLQGYWKFDGNATDASPNGYHLSNVGTPAYVAGDYWATGEQSGSQIDANYWSIPDANCPNLALAGTSFSMAAWIKMDVIGPNNIILRKFASNVGYQFRVDSSAYPTAPTGYLAISFGATEMTTQDPILSAGKWHHVSFVYDKARSVAAFYVDGNCVRSLAHSIDLGDNSVPCDVGYVFPGGFPSLSLKGNIKDLAVWNRALTPIEAKSLALGVDLQTLAYRPGNVSTPPTAWWKLNETSGSRLNAIRGPHPITVAASAQIDTDQSKFGGASLRVNGTTDYLRTPMSDSLNFGASDFTIEFWIRFAGSTGGSQYPIVFNRASGFDYITCGRAGEAWYFAMKDGNVIRVNIQEPDAISPNVWYHVACVRSGSSWKVYRDGQLKGAGATYAPACPNFVSEVDIGATDGANQVNGWIDEMRISKGIARYTSNFTPPAAPFTNDASTSLLLHNDGPDGSTNIVDSSASYGLDLTDINSVGSAGGFVEGVGASFNGDYLVSEDAEGTNLAFDSQEAALTVSLWVKPSGLGLSTIGVLAKVVSNADPNGYGIALHANGSAEFFVGRGGSFGSAQSVPNAVRVGAWSHLVGVHNPIANQVRLYVDGKLAATTSHVAGIGNTVGSRFTVGVNSGAIGGADYYSGQVSDAAIWRSALNDTDIKALATGLPIQRSGIVSNWSLDETSGTRMDSVGTNPLVPGPSGAGSAAGVVGNAVQFTGASQQFLNIADAAQTGLDISDDITVLYWAKLNTLANQAVLYKRDGANNGWGTFIVDGTKMTFDVNATSWVVASPQALTNFFHGALTFDGANARAFFNSALNNSTPTAARANDNSQPFYMGSLDGAQYFFDGLLDEVIVAQRWFRDEEIKTIYNKGLNGQSALTDTSVERPEIVVEQPVGTNLTDGISTVSFGSRLIGVGADLTFTIRNTGVANLTGLGVTVDGTNSADFTVITGPTAPVVAGSNTTFTVRFTPGGLGVRAGALHLASNDGDENPFDIALTGTGLSPLESWRQQYFGNFANNGSGADTNDFDHDGLKNFVEWAFGLNPTVAGARSLKVTNGTLTQRGTPTVTATNGTNFTAIFARRKNYATVGLTYTVRFSGDLLTWQTNTAVPTVIADDGEMQAVAVPFPTFPNGNRAGFFQVLISGAPPLLGDLNPNPLLNSSNVSVVPGNPQIKAISSHGGSTLITVTTGLTYRLRSVLNVDTSAGIQIDFGAGGQNLTAVASIVFGMQSAQYSQLQLEAEDAAGAKARFNVTGLTGIRQYYECLFAPFAPHVDLAHLRSLTVIIDPALLAALTTTGDIRIELQGLHQ